jgi:hypothetical protein
VYNFSSICVAISDCGPESLHLLQFNVKFSPPPPPPFAIGVPKIP